MSDQMIKHDPCQKIHQGWHLDKRISVAHFFATFAFATAIVSYQYAQSERITLVEQEASKHEAVSTLEFKGIGARLSAVQERDVAFKLEIIRRLERIEDGIDRHIETTSNHREN